MQFKNFCLCTQQGTFQCQQILLFNLKKRCSSYYSRVEYHRYLKTFKQVNMSNNNNNHKSNKSNNNNNDSEKTKRRRIKSERKEHFLD